MDFIMKWIKKIFLTPLNSIYIDIGTSLNTYKGIDIGDMTINSHRKLKYILEKKLENIEDKEIIKSLLRLRLYESIAILDNYENGIVNDNPALINKNIQEMIEIYEKFIWKLSENHNIKIHQRSNKT